VRLEHELKEDDDLRNTALRRSRLQAQIEEEQADKLAAEKRARL
jgi:hypothetical protein